MRPAGGIAATSIRVNPHALRYSAPGRPARIRRLGVRAPLILAFMALVCTAADSTPIEVRKARARALLDQMDFAGALAEARAINRMSADDIAGYQLMAAALLELGQYDEAEEQI